MENQVFDGLKVIEFGSWLSAPYLGKLFADFGADVIKIEPPDGDPARRLGPFPGDDPHPEKSGVFLFLNTSKRSITLNLETQSGRAILLSLLEKADLLIENNPPSFMDLHDLSFSALHELNPRLVVLSLTPFGQSGPYRDFKNSPLVSYSLSGLCYETPQGGVGEDRLESYPPVNAWGWHLAFTTAYNACWGAIGALMQREMSGFGQLVDVSEIESGAATMRPNVPEQYYIHQQPGWSKSKRIGGLRGGMYRTKDGYISMSGSDDGQWVGLKKVLGNPAWAESDAFSTMSLRIENNDAVKAMIRPWAAEHLKDDIYQWIQEAAAIAFPVLSPKEIASDGHNLARALFVEQEHPTAGLVSMPGAPFKLSGTPWRLTRPAPQLGEHTADVLANELGLSAEQIVQLRMGGAI